MLSLFKNGCFGSLLGTGFSQRNYSHDRKIAWINPTIYTYKGRTLASVLCSVYAPNIKTIYGNIPDVDNRAIEPNQSELCSIGSVIEHNRTETFRWVLRITELHRTNLTQSTRLVRFCPAERQNACSFNWNVKISLSQVRKQKYFNELTQIK